MPSQSSSALHLSAVCLPLCLAACAPAHDWREVRPPGSAAALLMPCKPRVQSRSIVLAGQTVRLELHACQAGGQTWALAWADMVEPAQVTAALRQLSASAAGNLGAQRGEPMALRVPGATPNPASARMHFSGLRPDGKAAMAQSAVFAHGTRVFQATVLGESVPSALADTFFDSLRAGP